jgi:protein-ribulosamine 3-kinase
VLSKHELNLIAERLELSENLEAQSKGGGDINEAYLLKAEQGRFFLKKNEANTYPSMFEVEAKGLNLLREAESLRIPEVLDVFENEEYQYLVLEYIEPGSEASSFWQYFAEQLAMMHKKSSESFGLDHDNYIGRLSQSNKEHSSWSDFFISQRLEPMIKMGVDEKQIPRIDLPIFDALFRLLEDFFPKEAPSLIHGDLWSGNFMADQDSKPVIYDPAVYFGHREMDIAMTKLFGGFDRNFYQYYQEAYPMEQGWNERVDIANIYPLLVHVNLFGGSYYQSVLRIIRDYC